MKKIKRFLLVICLLVFSTSIGASRVSAGNVTLTFTGKDSVKVNNNIEITLRASDISGLTKGLATVQGDIIFDSSYLEYVSFKAVSSKLSVSYGTKTNRFVALGMSGEYISSTDNLFVITFKAKKIGQTTINMNNVVIGDTASVVHGSNVVSKVINIVDNNPAPSTTTPQTPSKPTTKPSTPSTNTTPSKSDDNTLSSLIINQGKVAPNFDKNVLTYDVSIPSDIDKLDLNYLTSDKNAKVKVSNNGNFKVGVATPVTITVTAENGSVREYRLNVTKLEGETSPKLKSLKVKEGKFDFDPNTYEYTIKVKKDVTKLTIDAIPLDENDEVTIIGNKDLSDGTNQVLIRVTNDKGISTYYTLKVKKSSVITLFGISLTTILFIILIFLIIILFLLLLLLLKRKKEEEEEQNKMGDLIDDYKSHINENVDDDLYDDIVTKDELIHAIEEKNSKKLEMLLTQDKVNKMKEDLKKEEESNWMNDIN